ncbi:galactose mutarotase [Vibrio sp. SS-MA-C1-2]|uniref:aldose epimerase family protein n=1 Tax=Vibrio sp. SS-MA-C1-2 TaxID=2908646 RepID=UPI001F3DE06A|nr:aldose epimerase family protein [Vibrio sp. SS-MA-C1-2]UJF18246.1 galactose mutarotase [Vibrio sp. SS-MA-C1-2]
MMKHSIQPWGHIPQQAIDVSLITMTNSHGISISVSNFGCIVTSIIVPDRNGHCEDIVLGYETLEQYLNGHPFFGAVAGRYANRISDGQFQLDGVKFQLETNELPTSQHLHGGKQGFDKFVWDYVIEERSEATYIHFTRLSRDGESGYPGNLMVTHTIGLDEKNQVHYNFKSVTDAPTVINLVNHSYYNLAGHNSGSTENQELKLNADFYTPVKTNNIPTGEIKAVVGTYFDFTSSKTIGENSLQAENKLIDHNFIINKKVMEDQYALAAEMFDPESGRRMRVLTTQPAFQFYNGAKLSNKHWIGKGGYKYESLSGICLETQHYPDSPNQPHFPSTRLNPNEIFEEKTIHQFFIG